MARSAAIEEGALQTGGRFCRHKHIRDFMRCNSKLRHTRVHGWLCLGAIVATEATARPARSAGIDIERVAVDKSHGG